LIVLDQLSITLTMALNADKNMKLPGINYSKNIC